MRREGVGLLGHLLEQMRRRPVDERVHGIEPQRVNVVLPEPHGDVVEDVAAHRGLVEVDGGAPGVRAGLVQVRAEPGQVVPARPEVVVDDVLHHGDTARVAGVDEALVRGGTAVALVDGVPEHPVVAPVVGAVEPVDGQHLDEVDAELDEVVETADRRVERSLGSEGADVQLVDRAAAELPTGPLAIGPGELRRVERAGESVHAVGLAPRAGVGQRRLATVDQEPVVGGQVDGRVGERPPAVGAGGERMPDPVDLDGHALRQRRPDLVAHARGPSVEPGRVGTAGGVGPAGVEGIAGVVGTAGVEGTRRATG